MGKSKEASNNNFISVNYFWKSETVGVVVSVEY